MEDKGFLAALIKKADFYKDEDFFNILAKQFGLKECVITHFLQDKIHRIFSKERDFILARIIYNAIARWKILKEVHPKKILLIKNGGYYECYNSDAEKVAAIMGQLPLVLDNGFKYTYRISIDNLYSALPDITEAGYRVVTI